MYLSTKQHDLLQIIVTGFEIPFRTYISCTILDKYKNDSEFYDAINTKSSFHASIPYSQPLNSTLGSIKNNSKCYYNLLQSAKNIKGISIVEDEVNVPNVDTIVCLSIIFSELFNDLLIKYNDFNTYINQSFKYKYVRNKLNHRGCKTLETQDMTISLDFISNAMLLLSDDDSLFWMKKDSLILSEIKSLLSYPNELPIKIHNFQEMPFPNMRIVCRDKEISEIKEFIYGRQGALRKQSSLSLFGYGGVGKTALALEAIKQIVQDLQDNTTLNGYTPDFILFFTAKDESLSFSTTTGKIENISNRFTYKTSDELISAIFTQLNITDFHGFDKKGIIIVDNYETLSGDDRNRVHDFICFDSPQNIQYIITSRNEENFEVRKKIAGFSDDVAGSEFIEKYTAENEFDLLLNEDDIKTLLNISMGNTLVLVLCLRRLGLRISTVNSMAVELSSPISVNKLKNEIEKLPANGFEIISEFMFKNSFIEVQDLFKEDEKLLSSILIIFAVYPTDAIDIYTISMLSKQPYRIIDPILEILCKYLIVERNGEMYFLNQFAGKYIVELFLPDSQTYERISSEISSSTRKIQNELNELQSSIEKTTSLKQIIQDWNIISDGDKIAAAKAYKIYGEVDRECRTDSKFKISTVLSEAISTISSIEENTMHPYIKYQKARVLSRIQSTKVLEDDFTIQILQAYNETIWTIKTNSLYSSIKGTKSYASILWKYGIELTKVNTIEKYQLAARYFEESIIIFDNIDNSSEEYYKCFCILGNTYLDIYILNNNIDYLRKSRSVSSFLRKNSSNFFGKVKHQALSLRDRLLKYGNF